MSQLDMMLNRETEGPNSGLHQLITGLLEGEPQVSVHQAIGLARAVRWVLANADKPEVQRWVGQAYMSDLEVLVEQTGTRWLDYQRRYNLGGHREDDVTPTYDGPPHEGGW